MNLTNHDMVLFNKQLQTLATCNSPLKESFETLKNETNHKRLSDLYANLAIKLNSGRSLYDSLKEYGINDKIYLLFIKSAETSGDLYSATQSASIYYQKLHETNEQIKVVTVYPKIVFIISLIIFTGVMILTSNTLINTFENIYTGMNSSLPFLTQLIIKSSRYFKPDVIFIHVIFISFIAFLCFTNNKFIVKIRESFLSIIPFYHKAKLLQFYSGFTVSLSLMLKHNIPLNEILELLKNISEDAWIKNEIDKVSKEHSRGTPISVCFEKSKLFPPTFSLFLNSSKQDKIPDAFYQIGEYYNQESNSCLKIIPGIVELIFVIILGTWVGTMVLSIFLPMLKLVNG